MIQGETERKRGREREREREGRRGGEGHSLPPQHVVRLGIRMASLPGENSSEHNLTIILGLLFEGQLKRTYLFLWQPVRIVLMLKG